MSLIITCDTGGWKTPTRLRDRLGEFDHLANEPEPTPNCDTEPRAAVPFVPNRLSRQGVDRDANLAARKLAHHSGGVLISNEFRSDLIDVGRSLHHRDLFPPHIRALPAATRQTIIEEIHLPYRNRVQQQITAMLASWSYVVHLSVRTYDAKTNGGDWRRGDVGLLYDPSRPDEVDWCLDLIEELYESLPVLKVRRNHPRRGTNDSLTKSMRSLFPADVYLGIEMTLNRSWVARPVVRREKVLDRMGLAIGNLTAEPIRRAA